MGDSSQGQHQPRKRRSVFVSSTSRDLISHRQKVSDALLRLGLFPVAMEQFGAQGSGDATSVSTDKVAEAEIYLGIFAWRYGFVPPGETRSVTHLEYLEARKLGLPCYLFLARPDTEQDNALFPTSLRDPEHQAQLVDFRAELQNGPVVDYFTTPDDLAKEVATALHGWLLKEREIELRTGPRPPRDLPPRTPGFVGREREVGDLCAALRQGQSVALAAAVAGMGGVGKSALAAEVAHVLAAEPGVFPGGFAFVRCDERRDLPGLIWVYNQLLSAWNITLATEEFSGATTLEAEADLREQALRTRLRPAGNEQRPPALALLDNVERDLPLPRALETLAALNIAVLLTTRTEFRAPRLKLVKLDVLEPTEALALFAQDYARSGGEWDAARDAAPAAAIVKALGYLPLALGLAAPLAIENGCAALAREVQQAGLLDQLKDVLDAKHNVRYVLSKSLANLTPTQQARFTALSLPTGPDWPRPVIERMLDAVIVPSAEAASASADLSLLARLSLVKLLPAAAPDGAPRVWLHPLLRELTREAWANQPAEMQQTALEALLEEVHTLTEAHEDDFATLEREEELIAGTLRQVAREHLAPRILDKVIDNLVKYLNIGGHWRLGMELLALQLAVLRDLGDRSGEGTTLLFLGTLEDSLGRKEEARRYLEQALDIAREVGDRLGEGTTLNNLGMLKDSLGRKEEARHYYEQALNIARETENRLLEGLALNNLGNLEDSLGRKEEARRYVEQALDIARETENRRIEGTVLNNLGNLEDSLGRKEEARHYFEQALEIVREVGDRRIEATTLNNLGKLAGDLGKKKEAARYVEQALDILRAIGDRRMEGTTLNNLGMLADSLGQKEESARYFEQALIIAREVGDRRAEGMVLNNLGMLANSQKQWEEAARYLERALVIMRDVSDLRGEVMVLSNLGTLADNRGKQKEARDYLEQALVIARQAKDKQMEGTILNRLGELVVDHGWRGAKVIRYHVKAIELLADAGDQAGAAAAATNLGNALVSTWVWRRLAVRWYKLALSIQQEIKDRGGEAATLRSLGTLAEKRGKKAEAIDYYEQALVIRRELGDRAWEATLLGSLGTLAEKRRRKEEAARCYEQALAIRRELGHRYAEATMLSNLGRLAKAQGRKDEAIQLYQQAVVIFDETKSVNSARAARKSLTRLGARDAALAGPAT